MAHMSLHFYISTVWVYGIGAFFNPIVAELGWTRTQFSLAAGLTRLEGSVATPIEGYLVDRFGSRKMVLVGVPLTAIALMLLSRVDSLLAFYAA
jgi:sugar phosphate permease